MLLHIVPSGVFSSLNCQIDVRVAKKGDNIECAKNLPKTEGKSKRLLEEEGSTRVRKKRNDV